MFPFSFTDRQDDRFYKMLAVISQVKASPQDG